MIRSPLKLPSRRLSAAVVLLVALGAAATAWAYFSGAGNGTAQASVGRLDAPSITSATPGAGTVALNWNTVSPPAGASAVRYYVTRDGGAPAGDCATSAATATTATSCTDSGLNAGQHGYRIVAVWRSWTATSPAASVTVAALSPSSVAAVSGSGQSAAVNTAFANSLVAIVKDAGGNPVPGTVVTFTAPSSGASGTFANGTTSTTATTASNGQATAGTFGANTTAGNYTVTASVSGAGSASFSLTNNQAAASKLAFTTQPAGGANVSAGSTINLGVSVEDQYGNVEAGDNASTVTLATGSNPGASTLGCSNPGGATVTVAAGVAGYSCSLNKPGTGYTLTATSSPAHGTATSNSFNIVVGSPATVAVSSGSGQSATINTAFSNALVAKVTDAGNNAVAGATVTFTAPPSGASGTFAGGSATTTASTNASGLATAGAFTANSVAGSYSVSASVSGASAAGFGLTNKPGAASKLAFTQQSGGASAGSVFITQPAVAVEDASGNIVTTDTTQVTLSIASGTPNPGGSNPQLKGCSSTSSGGVTTFSGCQITQWGQGYVLSATDGSLTSAPSSAFNVSNSASKLVFTTQPGGAITGGVAFPTQPVVTVEDSNGNTVYNDTHALTVAITSGTGAGGATLSGCTQSETNGVVSLSGCEIDKAGTGYTLTATYGGQVTAATSGAFNVVAGPATQLLLSAATTNPTAGAGDNLTITAQDAGGNTSSGYSGSHTLSFSGASHAPSGAAPTVSDGSGTDQPFGASTAINFTSGVATVSGAGNGVMKLYNAGSATIAVTDGTLTSSGIAVTVSPATANKLAFTQQPAGATGGTALTTQPKVAVQDQYGNTATTDASSVTLAITSGSGASGATLSGCSGARSAGVTTFSGCKIDKAGTGYTLTAGDGSLTSATSNAFNLTVGAAAKLAFSQSPGGGQAGSAFSTQPIVTVQDAGGNTVTTNTANITLAIGTNPGGGTLTCTTNPLTAGSGVAGFSGCAINKAGTGYTLIASATGLSSATSATFNVLAGPASQLLLSATTTSPAAGAGDNLTITAQDAFGNTAAGYTGAHNVSFSGAGNAPSGTAPTVTDSSGTAQTFGTPTAINFTGGVAGVSGAGNGVMKLYNAGSATIAVTDGTLTSSGLVVTVGPATANRLAFTQQPAGATGGTSFSTQAKVAVQDQYGNTATTDASSVTLAITSGSGASGATLSGCSGARSAGVTTFSGCKIDKAGTGYTLTAGDGSLTSATSNSFNVTVGPAAKLAFIQQPAGATGGTAFTTQPKVAVEDAGGNVVGADTSNVTLAIGTNPGGGTLGCATNPLAAASGVAGFSGCAIDKAGTGYTLTATDGSLTTATSAAFNVTVGPAAKLTFTQQPSGAAAATGFATQPAVAVQDAGGNTVTGDASSVTLAITPGSGTSGATLSGCSGARSGGVTTFSGCQIDKYGTGYSLTAGDGSLTGATSAPFDVIIGYKEASGTSATTGTTVASSLTLTPNHTYVVFAFSDSASTNDTVSVAPSGFTTNPAVNTIGTASYDSKDIEWAGYLSGGTGAGTLTATFHNTIKQAYLEVIDVTGANTNSPVAQSAPATITGTTQTNPATANLTNTPIGSNGELVYWNSDQNVATPTSSSSSLSSISGTSNQATTGSQAVFGGTPPQQTESLNMGTNRAWGTIAVEINHG